MADNKAAKGTLSSKTAPDNCEPQRRQPSFTIYAISVATGQRQELAICKGSSTARAVMEFARKYLADKYKEFVAAKMSFTTFGS